MITWGRHQKKIMLVHGWFKTMLVHFMGGSKVERAS